MNFEDIVKLQEQFDIKHGWSPNKSESETVFHVIQTDLIGILGEIGEFANIIKKLALEVEHDSASNVAAMLTARHDKLAEELVDAFIYLIRLASHLDINIEAAYLEKLKINEQRFKRFEQPQP